MKILIAVYSLTYGGAEKQAVVDANALQERGHQVAVAFYKNGELSKLLHKDIKLYKVHAKNVVLAGIQLFFHTLFHRYDVLHAHMFWAEKITAAGRLLGQRVIMNEHGLGVWRKWHHSLVMRMISRGAHMVINSCDATKDNRVKIDRLKTTKLMTVYNSFEIDSAEIDAQRKKEKEENNRNHNGSFTVGFVGRFDPVKRLQFYIPLAKILRGTIPSIKFLLVGDGTDREELEALVKKEGLEKHFHFPGFILGPGKYLCRCDAFFMPSKREAFSIALLEAGAYSLPAIAFKVGGNAELIKDGETGFIVPDEDIEAAAAKLIYLYENPFEREKIGRQAHQHVTETFSIKNRTDQLEKLFTQS